MADNVRHVITVSDNGEMGSNAAYSLQSPSIEMDASKDLPNPNSGISHVMGLDHRFGVAFQGPVVFGRLINEEECLAAISRVLSALENSLNMYYNSGKHRRTINGMPSCYSMPPPFVYDSAGIFSNRTYAQAFKETALERLYGLNVSSIMHKRYVVVNAVVLAVTLATWAVVTCLAGSSEFVGNNESIIMNAFHVVTAVTCGLLILTAGVWFRCLRHLGEYSCYVSYSLIMALWVTLNYVVQGLSADVTKNSYRVVTIGAILWASNFVFGLGIIVIMDLFLPLRSCWSIVVHISHVAFHLMGIITTLLMQPHPIIWVYGALKILIYAAIVACCFWFGCNKEFELRRHFLAWASELIKAEDTEKPDVHDTAAPESWYDGVSRHNVQSPVDTQLAKVQQYSLKLMHTLQDCMNMMRSGETLYTVPYNDLDIRDNQLEVMDAYVWGSKERLSIRALVSIKTVDMDLGSQIERELSITYKPLSTSDMDAITAMDRSSLISHWNFDVLKYFQTAKSPFISLGYGLLARYEEHCNVEKSTILNFLSVLEALYRDVPYHNKIHGAMVAQKIMCLANYIGLLDKMTILEEAVMVVSALAHDVGHPARNNAFFVRTHHPIAQIYNDNSVLENFHAACTFKILRIHDCNLFSVHEHDSFRSQMIELILATDTVDHFQMVSQFNMKCKDADFSFDDPKSRAATSKMLMKAADVSAPTMLWESSLEWVERLMGEFYSQGDEETTLGIPISALCDRTHHDQLAKSQTAFLKIIVSPLYQSIALVKKTKEIESILQQLEENTAKWHDMQTSDITVSPYKFEGYGTTLDVSWIFSAMDLSPCNSI